MKGRTLPLLRGRLQAHTWAHTLQLCWMKDQSTAGRGLGAHQLDVALTPTIFARDTGHRIWAAPTQQSQRAGRVWLGSIILGTPMGTAMARYRAMNVTAPCPGTPLAVQTSCEQQKPSEELGLSCTFQLRTSKRMRVADLIQGQTISCQVLRRG